MTLRARLFAWFPTAWLLSCAACAVAFIIAPSVGLLLGGLAIIYLLPVACYRAHNALWPLNEGRSFIDAPSYSPWWGGHQFQVVYTAFPAFETALRLMPGVYSAWLRLWGSRIGRGVYWPPIADIPDRALLEVGDGAIFGNRIACYAHVILRRERTLVLYVRRIRIGERALVGAGSRLGPGTQIEAGYALPALTDATIGRRFRQTEPPC